MALVCEGALNLYTKKLALFRQFSAGLFGTKNTNGWLHMCRRPSVLKQGAGATHRSSTQKVVIAGPGPRPAQPPFFPLGKIALTGRNIDTEREIYLPPAGDDTVLLTLLMEMNVGAIEMAIKIATFTFPLHIPGYQAIPRWTWTTRE